MRVLFDFFINIARWAWCHHKEFFFLSDYVINSLSGDYESGPLIAAPTLPCVAIVCKHCGFVSQHSVTTLLKGDSK